MKVRRLIVGALFAFVLLVPSGTALADNTKTCGSTTTATSPNGTAQGTPWTTSTTTTQTSSCNSNSDTGQTTTSTTTNGGGHPK